MEKHKSGSAAARMHRYTLQLQPPCDEQAYYHQFEALDLINCLIAPLFFANALSMFSADLLSSIYCAVLLIKGYQVGLLLLPAARQQRAHERSRYWLILAERVLRQWFATPLLGRGPRFQNWILTAAETSSKLMFCCKTLVLISGATISWWNAFCLPLDFTSQVTLTSVFFAIHFQASVTQVVYPFQVLVQHVPYILMVQQSIEYVLQKALKLLLMPLGSAGCNISSPAGLTGVAGAGPALGCSSVMMPAGGLVYNSNTASALAPVLATATESHFNGSAAAAASGVCPNQPVLPIPATGVGGLQFEQPSRAPDLASLAGRFILATSTAYMLLVVLILPLYVAWNLERHWKSNFLAQRPGLQRQTQQQQQQQPGGASAVAEQQSEAHCASAAAGCVASNHDSSSCSEQTWADVGGQSQLQEQDSKATLCEMLLGRSALVSGEPCPAAQPAVLLSSSSEDKAAAAAFRSINSSKLAAQDMHPGAPPQADDSDMLQGNKSNSSVDTLLKQLHSSAKQLGCSDKQGMHRGQVATERVIHALPKGKVLCQQLALLVGISFGCGQAFVLLLSLFPKLTCLFWQQIIF